MTLRGFMLGFPGHERREDLTSRSLPGTSAIHRFAPSLPLITALVVYLTTLLSGSGVLREPDPYWQVATGQWILAHRAVPHHDIFSYTMTGAPWVVHEWLAACADAVLYGLFGWAGLVVVAAVALAAAVGLLLRALLRYLEPVYALVGALAFWGMAQPHAFARPHLYALPILVAWLAALVCARAEERPPRLWWALLMVPWANLHGGFLLGDALAGMLAIEMALEQPDWPALRRQAPGWAAFVVLSVLAGMATPNGLAGLLMPFRLIGMSTMMNFVIEWRGPNFQTLQPLELWLLLALLGVLSFGVRVPVTRAAMLLLFLHMALAHQRFAALLGLAAPLLVAPSLAPQLASLNTTAAGSRLARLGVRAGAGSVAAAVGIAALLAWAVVARGVVNDSTRYTPAAAVAFVQAHHIAGPVLNAYDFGGYLIFVGMAPYLDGRAEIYGDAFLRRDENPAQLPAVLAQYHVAWTLLQPGDPRVTVLDHLPGWHRLYSDDRAIVHVRDDPAGA